MFQMCQMSCQLKVGIINVHAFVKGSPNILPMLFIKGNAFFIMGNNFCNFVASRMAKSFFFFSFFFFTLEGMNFLPREHLYL